MSDSVKQGDLRRIEEMEEAFELYSGLIKSNAVGVFFFEKYQKSRGISNNL